MPQPEAFSQPRLALKGLSRILRRLGHDRIVIAGGPKVGKSTLASYLMRDGMKLHGGEELRDFEWSAGSAHAAEWLDEPGPWICENVAMARALRKWLVTHPTGKPADLLVVLRHPLEDRKPQQITMAKGCETVWQQIAPEIDRRGVAIVLAHPVIDGPWLNRNWTPLVSPAEES